MEKDKIIKIIIATIIGVCAILYYILNGNDSYEEILTNEIVVNEVTVSEQIVEKEKIKVYITGEVKNPGVIELDEGSRIDDAINMAGGLTQDADLSNINLAYEIDDGEKICIPNINEENDSEETQNKANESSSNKKVNINKAGISELTQIPGIGASTAEKIVSYREENGKFSTIEDIKNVTGIGNSKYNSIKEYISVK